MYFAIWGDGSNSEAFDNGLKAMLFLKERFNLNDKEFEALVMNHRLMDGTRNCWVVNRYGRENHW